MPITLRVIEGPHTGRTFVFERHDTFIVGRSPQAHFHLPDDPYFSRVHFIVEVNPPHCSLSDLKSHNRTLVNNVPVESCMLKQGDVIRAGKTSIRIDVAENGVRRVDPPADAPDVDLRELQRQDWQAERSYRVEDYRARFPQLGEDRTLLLDLIMAEIELREQRGEKTAMAEYERRFPELRAALKLAALADPRSSAPAPLRPKRLPTIPGYRIEEELGSGGMGIVYRAVRETDNAEVALKTIRTALVCDEQAVRRFVRETEILKRLRHPAIVGFLESGAHRDLLYFAMEFVAGTDAAKLLEANGPLKPRRAVQLILPVLEGLAEAHALGFVHRDIKPANLLVTRQNGLEGAKLADFGLARAYQDTAFSGITMVGAKAGTPPFMPPEQVFEFRSVQPSADQYSTAATLYYLLTGCFLYDAKDANDFLRRVLLENPVPLLTRRPGLPSGLAEVIHQATARDPAARYRDIGAFRKALQCFA